MRVMKFLVFVGVCVWVRERWLGDWKLKYKSVKKHKT